MIGLDATISHDGLSTTLAAGADDLAAAEHEGADLERGTLVGRYVVISRLGAGGMGVVYMAYDPELDRKVALKLLHPRHDADPLSTAEARQRLIREAQALARLSHPHIVAIHDVGEHQRSIWLAMEYVDGRTLSVWLAQRRTWQEVLHVLVPAARGLAAAHAVGIVHRDIKPDNIMIGSDERVRVMDLGLSRTQEQDTAATKADTAPYQIVQSLSVTRAGAIMGTPQYMSPEQFLGRPVDARTDVFSLCVTLWEALMGERPFFGATLAELERRVLAGKVRPVPQDRLARRVPGWLRRVCLQGLAAAPERRFASMAALLDALAHGQTGARARRWSVGVAALATVAAASVGLRHHEHAGRVAACAAAGASITEVWNDEARAAVRDGLVATGVSNAATTAARVVPLLDEHADAWSERRTDVCTRHDVAGTLSVEHLDRAVWCLDERRMELTALVAALTHADKAVVQKAVTAAAELPPISPCSDDQVLAALPSPPPAPRRPEADEIRAALSHASTELHAGRFAASLDEARQARTRAEALGWPSLVASAQQIEALALTMAGSYPQAEAASRAAFRTAARVRAWDVAAAAATHLVYTVGYLEAHHAEGKVWAEYAELAAAFAGDPLGLREALRLRSLGKVDYAAGAFAEARALYERALARAEEALGPDHLAVATTLNDLGAVYGRSGATAEALATFERALAIREKALGPDHPDVAASLDNLGNVHALDETDTQAAPLYERALLIREKALGPDHPHVANSLINLAGVDLYKQDYAAARTRYQRALEILERALGPDHPDVAVPLLNLGNVLRSQRAYPEAMRSLQRALAIQEKALGPDHPDVADTLFALGALQIDTGVHAAGRVTFERVLAIREKTLGPDHPDVAVALSGLAAVALSGDQPLAARAFLERAVAIHDAHEGVQFHEYELRFELARLLARTDDRPRALVEARKAADGFRADGDPRAAEVDAFLAEQRDPR